VIRRLFERLADGALAADGEVLLEIGSDQGDTIVETVAAALPDWTCRVELDLAGLPRVARIGPPRTDG
jgi:hypothetical protein